MEIQTQPTQPQVVSAGKVLNFSFYKKKYDETTIYVGDVVEWRDYDGQTHTNVVEQIEWQTRDWWRRTESRQSLPLLDKNSYILILAAGLSIAGCTVVRKVVRKAPSIFRPKARKKKIYDAMKVG